MVPDPAPISDFERQLRVVQRPTGALATPKWAEDWPALWTYEDVLGWQPDPLQGPFWTAEPPLVTCRAWSIRSPLGGSAASLAEVETAGGDTAPAGSLQGAAGRLSGRTLSFSNPRKIFFSDRERASRPNWAQLRAGFGQEWERLRRKEGASAASLPSLLRGWLPVKFGDGGC